jgi:hypothetical protein
VWEKAIPLQGKKWRGEWPMAESLPPVSLFRLERLRKLDNMLTNEPEPSRPA